MSMFSEISEEYDNKQFCKELEIIMQESFNTIHEDFARRYIYQVYRSHWNYTPTLKTFEELKEAFNNPKH